jgi:hypothetical protein
MLYIQNNDEEMIIDRNNQNSVAEVIKELIPEGVNPRKCLDFLANSICVADVLAPDCWGITLQKKLIRLNVGMIEVFAFFPDIVHCLLDLDTIPKALWKDKRVELLPNKNNPEAGCFKSVPGSVICDMFVEDSEEVLALIQDSHQLLLENASQTRRHPRTKIAHSPAVADYLSSYLGRNIPQPAYFLRQKDA